MPLGTDRIIVIVEILMFWRYGEMSQKLLPIFFSLAQEKKSEKQQQICHSLFLGSIVRAGKPRENEWKSNKKARKLLFFLSYYLALRQSNTIFMYIQVK